MTSPDTFRVDQLERRLSRLEAEVAELRTVRARDVRPSSSGREPVPDSAPVVMPEPRRAFPPPPPRVAPQPREPRFTFDAASLFGARALAVTGGIVTLLGILFFFVLAVNRGWIGPGARVFLGGLASSIVFSAGLWLRRRFGETHSALAAVGVGIAGAYSTLLAATALYGLVSSAGALFVAVVVAVVGTATALSWRSELVAGLGLVGAALAPLMLAAQGGVSSTGTAFAAIVFAGTAAVAVRERWRWLLVVGAGATVVQVAALVGKASGAPAAVVALAAVCSFLYAASGVAWQLRHGGRLLPLTTGLVSLGVALGAGSSLGLWSSDTERGFAALVVALVLLAAAAGFFRERTKDLSALLAAAALTGAAIALGELLSGRPLTYAWAAEAATLAWLSRRVREVRYQLFGLVYLALATFHALALDAPPRRLFVAHEPIGTGALAVFAVGLAAAVFGTYTRPWREEYEGPLGSIVRAFQRSQPQWRCAALWSAGVLGAYAAALGLVQLLGLEWGHAGADGVWAVAGLVAVVAGLGRGRAQLAYGGLVWFGAAALVAALFDAHNLSDGPRALGYLLLAVAGLAAGLACERQSRVRLVEGIAGVPVAASLALALGGAVPLAGSQHLIGASLVGLGAVYGAASLTLRARREACTLLWTIALLLGAAAAPLLLERTWVVLAWSAASVAAALGAVRLGERRLFGGALGYLALAAGDTLILRAPPTHLFTAHADPAMGVPALLLTLAAVAVIGRCMRRVEAWWVGGVVALYTVSLAILEFAQKLGAGTLDASFHAGHSAISAVWGFLGLVLLYLGLTRRPALRVAGFALFAISLGKLFLFDLPSLSSVTRALSFLAVGALLLLGGFFYQRLLAGERPRNA